MLLLEESIRYKMGMAGRSKIVKEYDEKIVIGKYMEEIKILCKGM